MAGDLSDLGSPTFSQIGLAGANDKNLVPIGIGVFVMVTGEPKQSHLHGILSEEHYPKLPKILPGFWAILELR